MIAEEFKKRLLASGLDKSYFKYSACDLVSCLDPIIEGYISKYG